MIKPAAIILNSLQIKLTCISQHGRNINDNEYEYYPGSVHIHRHDSELYMSWFYCLINLQLHTYVSRRISLCNNTNEVSYTEK